MSRPAAWPRGPSPRPSPHCAGRGRMERASRIHRPIRVWRFAEHLRRIYRLDSCRRQIEHAGIVEAHGVLDGETAFRHVTVVRAIAFERALLVRGPHDAAL